jgi:hypothetical protein
VTYFAGRLLAKGPTLHLFREGEQVSLCGRYALRPPSLPMTDEGVAKWAQFPAATHCTRCGKYAQRRR